MTFGSAKATFWALFRSVVVARVFFFKTLGILWRSVVCDACGGSGVPKAREVGVISLWLAPFRDVSAIKTEALAPPMIRASFTLVLAP
ncbi:hypothetical protein [Acidovorax radicis]|jgi:hypothetical protein|uniref:hypothetical protein n=1 Tax=Acidovorax radicis TaxID=758826 RepID=UPI001CF96D61|nr:hypothetical protein [Acidovorax radicis]UCV00014.1 hypothetical protein KI609_04285 [Acidovorax radicis]